MQLGLILAYWANTGFLEMEGLSQIPAGKNNLLELYLPILTWRWEKVNTQDYDRAQCWGALGKRSYLAVHQLDKAVSIIDVICLAGSDATQLVTHT